MNARLTNMFPLRAENISFAPAGTPILSDVSLTLEAGSFTAMLGPNGAGKSVMMRLLHGLLKPTGGTLQWGALDVRPQQQAMLFQRPVMLRRSVLGNVVYGLHVQGVPPAEASRRAQEALAMVGLSHLADRPARVLSGGEQQRAQHPVPRRADGQPRSDGNTRHRSQPGRAASAGHHHRHDYSPPRAGASSCP
jgi:tungstate transport system ATP-binding protein